MISPSPSNTIRLRRRNGALPGMSGYELAAQAWKRWPDLRIIVMSGNDLGGKGYAVVRKPFSQPQLEKIVADAVSGGT
jgi:CheY-like chemotaxis protein